MREKYCSLAEKVRPIEQGKDQQRDLESQSYQAVHAMNSPAPFRMQSKPSTEEPNRLVRKERRSTYIHCKMKKLTASKNGQKSSLCYLPRERDGDAETFIVLDLRAGLCLFTMIP